MAAPSDQPAVEETLDPVFLHARREAIFILLLFAVSLIWSVGLCYWQGYLSEQVHREEIATWLGIPSWAFWGILVPWVAVDLATVWFCFFYMVDDDLGHAQDESPAAADSSREQADA